MKQLSLPRIYKKGQGKYTRLLTVIGVVGLVAIGAYRLSEVLRGTGPMYVRFGVPTIVVLGLGGLVIWLVNRQKTADFLIATEGEMKKVSWSSRKEVIGSTKVVIVATFVLAVLLYGVDLLFIFLFNWLPMK